MSGQGIRVRFGTCFGAGGRSDRGQANLSVAELASESGSESGVRVLTLTPDSDPNSRFSAYIAGLPIADQISGNVELV